MEKVRQSIEVLTGERISFVHIDFNTGRARVSSLYGTFEMNVMFLDFEPTAIAHLGLESVDNPQGRHWYTARFDFDPDGVRIISDQNPVRRGPDRQHSMWWAGRSYLDRRLEPLHRSDVEAGAEARGLSVEEYLKLED